MPDLIPSRDAQVPDGSPARQVLYLEQLVEGTTPPTTRGVVDVWHLVLDRKWMLIGIVIIATSAAAIISSLETPMFEATSTIELQEPTENINVSQATTDSQTDSWMHGQVKILQSRTVHARTMQALATHKRVWSRQLNRVEAIMQALGFPIQMRSLRSDKPSLPPVNVTVKNFDNTRLVEIRCESPDAAFAAEYANTFATEFSKFQIETRLRAAQLASGWINSQLDDVKGKLQTAEQNLEAFSRKAGWAYGPDEQKAEQTRLAELEEELSKASDERTLRQSAYEIAVKSPPEDVPQVIDNVRLSNYIEKLSDLKRQEAELRTQMTPDHPQVKRVAAQIAQLQDALNTGRQQIIMGLKHDYESALRREQLLKGQYEKQKTELMEAVNQSLSYDLLRREVDNNRNLYSELLAKSKEANLALAMKGSMVHVVDEAEVPRAPFRPRTIRNCLFALLSGLLFGVFYIVASDQIRRCLKAPGETPYHLRLPELGVIPERRSIGTPTGPKALAAVITRRGRAMRSKPLLRAWEDDSSSLIAESFRSTVASIIASSQAGSRVILVTSPSRGDGKSTTVSNLGLALAEIKQRVLLIDADMRKPQLHRLFNMPNSWGLSDLLSERTPIANIPIEALCRKTGIAEELRLLSSGPGTATIANLLYSKRVAELIERARQEFDFVLIDTPPMSYISDARVLGRLSDGVVLVVRAGHTTRDQALAAKERLIADRIRILGTVLNGWDARMKGRYMEYRYLDVRSA